MGGKKHSLRLYFLDIQWIQGVIIDLILEKITWKSPLRKEFFYFWSAQKTSTSVMDSKGKYEWNNQ
jgi:hypothetical protein